MLQDFRLVLPEEVLSTGALLLMLVAAWAGDRSAKALTWLAILLLAVAAVLLPGLGLGFGNEAGSAFFGLFAADSFAAYAKIVIYAAAAVSMVAAMGWF